ncbi:hypothetical protein PoB_002553300 [Plakobranchus ocellatus]|uniref:Uncharacterized protein n=1 Tax=Plakobranchus ocellatus TaxID=259542 RepID=A0AAV3ZX60_9GAST|nr:hypothetical protein PoB_002553300 [Plakobranchus ocellatus]
MAAGTPVFLLCPHSRELQLPVGVPDLHTPDSLLGDDTLSSTCVSFLTSSQLVSSSSSCSSSSSTPDQETVVLPGSLTTPLTFSALPTTALNISSRTRNSRQLPVSSTGTSSPFLAHSNVLLRSVARGERAERITSGPGNGQQRKTPQSSGRSCRRPDSLMFARPDAVSHCTKITRSASRKAKLSRVAEAAGSLHPRADASRVQSYQCSMLPESGLGLPDARSSVSSVQSSLAFPVAESFSRRLLAGAVQAAQHLEETLPPVTCAQSGSLYLDTPSNYELYLASAQNPTNQTLFGSNNASAKLSDTEAFPSHFGVASDAQRSLALPPISTICGIPQQQQQVGYVFDNSFYHGVPQNHIHRNGRARRLPLDKSAAGHNVAISSPADHEVIIIDDEPDSISTSTSSTLDGKAATYHQTVFSQSDRAVAHTATHTSTSHTTAWPGSGPPSPTVKKSVQGSNLKSRKAAPKKCLRIDSSLKISDACFPGSEEPEKQFTKVNSGNRVTESGFDFSPAYLSSRRAGFDFSNSGMLRNTGASLDGNLTRLPFEKQWNSNLHSLGDAAAKPHYSSDDTLVTPSVFVFPSNETEISQTSASDTSDKNSRVQQDTSAACARIDSVQSTGVKGAGISERYPDGPVANLTPVSPPGKPPGNPRLADNRAPPAEGLPGFQLLVSRDGSVCPRAHEEAKASRAPARGTHRHNKQYHYNIDINNILQWLVSPCGLPRSCPLNAVDSESVQKYILQGSLSRGFEPRYRRPDLAEGLKA